MFNWIPFLTYVFVSTFTPGPNNILSMINGNHHGYKGTVKFLFGVCTGIFIIMLLSSYFNLILVNLIPKIQTFVEIIGALYMLYLAFKIMVADINHSSEADNQGLNTFKRGLLLQFVNPKVILYGITIYATFIIPHFHRSLELILFSSLFAAIAFIGTTSWALFGALFQSFLSKHYRLFQLSMGALLIYSAISIVGLNRLFP